MVDELDDIVVLGEDEVAAPADPDVVVIAAEGDRSETLPETAALQEDGSVILTLRYPVVLRWKSPNSAEVREDRTETLRMHRLNGAAMRAIMDAGAGHTVTVGIAKSCRMETGKLRAMYDRMDGADATAAAQVLSYFLNPGAKTATGPRSSP